MRALLGIFLGLGLASLVAADGARAQDAGPRIAVDPTSWDFGRALQNKTLHKDFVVRNIGTEALVIDHISTTCGCTVVGGYANRIKPGESTTLGVDLQTRSFAGRVERKVLIRSNDEENDPLTLTLQATVVAGP